MLLCRFDNDDGLLNVGIDADAPPVNAYYPCKPANLTVSCTRNDSHGELSMMRSCVQYLHVRRVQ